MSYFPHDYMKGKGSSANRLLRHLQIRTLSLFIVMGIDIDFVMLICQIQSQYSLELKQQRDMNINHQLSP